MSIESIAVNEIRERFSWCAYLNALIDDNDRTPFTDGHIDIYDESTARSGLIGRVPVQVKGRQWKKKFPAEATFPLSMVDANGYLALKGVILFVVLIDTRKRSRKAYYNILTPSKLIRFIENAGAQKQKTLRLAKLPEGELELRRIAAFAHQSQKEDVSVVVTPRMLEEGVTFTLLTPRPPDFSKPLHLDHARSFTDDFSLYVRTADGFTAAADGLLSILPYEYVDHPMALTISAGDVTFRSPSGRKIDDRTLRISPLKNLFIELVRDGDLLSGKITATDQGSMADYRSALKFLLNAHQSGALNLDGRPLPFQVDGLARVDDLRERVEALERYAELFDLLEVQEAILSADELDERASNELDALYRALVESEQVPAKAPESGRISSPLFGWRIELYCDYDERSNSWTISNPFSDAWGRQIITADEAAGGRESYHRATVYDLLEPEIMATTVNLRLGRLVSAYEELPSTRERGVLANRTVLKLIAASDMSELRSDELLEAATALNSWLLEAEPESPIHNINAWQIAVRGGGLDAEQIRAAHRLMHSVGHGNSAQANIVGFLCAVLLGSHVDIRFWHERLTDDEIEELASWPIARLIDAQLLSILR